MSTCTVDQYTVHVIVTCTYTLYEHHGILTVHVRCTGTNNTCTCTCMCD